MWPSRHDIKIKKSLGTLLYKIGKGIKFDFGKLVYQIMALVDSHGGKASLLFPNLIFDLLVEQGPEKDRFSYEEEVKQLIITEKLMKGKHLNDLDSTTRAQRKLRYLQDVYY